MIKSIYLHKKEPLMFEQVKICALILVDELIIDNAYFYSKKYWQEVKQEIEKL